MKFLREGPLANGLNRMIDLILLNVLWFLCSLPIITLGASTCAVYAVTLRYALHEDVPIVRTFFGEFRKHFKKATILFALFLAAGLFLALDLWAAVQWDIDIRFVYIVLILSVCYFYLAILSHVFPVLAYFDLGIKTSVRKAFVFSMKNGIFTVFIMILNVSPILAIALFPNFFGQILFFYFILGFTVIALLSSLHLIRLFDPERVKTADDSDKSER